MIPVFLENLDIKLYFLHFAPTPTKTSLRWSHSGPRSERVNFLLQNNFLGPKCNLGPECTFGAKSYFSEKCYSEQKVHFGTLTNSHTCYLFLPSGHHDAPKSDFCTKHNFLAPESHFCTFCEFGSQSALFAQKCTFASPCRGCL